MPSFVLPRVQVGLLSFAQINAFCSLLILTPKMFVDFSECEMMVHNVPCISAKGHRTPVQLNELVYYSLQCDVLVRRC